MLPRASLDRSALRPIFCPDLVRVGSDHGDGGYVVPLSAVRAAGALVSLGLSDDWSFDDHFRSLNPDVFIVGVDHSISPLMFAQRSLKHRLKSIAYRTVGARSKADKHRVKAERSASYFTTFRSPHQHVRKKVGPRSGRDECTLDSLLADARAKSQAPIFLKVDIESSEYLVLADLIRHAEHVHCVVVEFHELDTRAQEFNDLVGLLQEHYSIVHIHGNNYAPYDPVLDFPVSVEVTFLRTDHLDATSVAITHELPRTDLDRPNAAGIPDHPLRFITMQG